MQRLILQFSSQGGVTLAAPQPPIENLVFGGGGVRGIVYPSAVKVLHERDMLQNVKRVAGSSSGALSALVVGLGYTPDEFEKFSMELNKSDFVNSKLTLDGVKNFFEGGEESLGQGKLSGDGIFSGDNVYKKVQSVIRAKVEAAVTKYPDLADLKLDFNKITFKNLHDIAKRHPDLEFKDIFITGTNKTDNSLKVFSCHDPDTQDVEVALAVRISMSIPVLYQAMNLNGKQYEDGGCLNNFPIDIFDNPPYLPTSKYDIGEQGQNLCSFGLKVDTAERMKYLMWHNKQAELLNASLFQKLKTGFAEIKTEIANAVTEVISGVSYNDAMREQNQRIRDRYQQRVLQIDDLNVGNTDFSVSNATKQKMLQSGHDAAIDWCDAHQDEMRFIASGKRFKDLVNSLSMQDLGALCKGLKDKSVTIVASTPEQAESKRTHCQWIADDHYRHALTAMRKNPEQQDQLRECLSIYDPDKLALSFGIGKVQSAPKKQEEDQVKPEPGVSGKKRF